MDTEIALALAQLGESTDRLLATADALTDAQAAAPSRLPGWTRGHVLTHLARNADGFRNLLTWAGTGNETPMYPSEEARARGVEQGAGRSAAEIAADVQVSAAALAAAAQDLPARAWDALVARRGDTFPARQIPSRRLAEPRVILCVAAITATTPEEAEEVASTIDLWRLRIRHGVDLPVPSRDEARAYPYTLSDRDEIAYNRHRLTLGAPGAVRERIETLSIRHEADEAMILTITPDYASRARSYALIADAFSLAPTLAPTLAQA